MNTRTVCVAIRRSINGALAVAALLVAVSAGNATTAPQGGWVGAGSLDQQTAADVLASKPHNTWTTKALREAGFRGCVAVAGDVVTFDHAPTGHVVRLPIAEGWDYVVMSPAQVAARTEAFGGTPSTADDVKLVGNCY